MANNKLNAKSRRHLLLFASFLTLLFVFSAPVLASAKTNALKAYDNYLKSQGSYPGFAIIYLNNDAVPELVHGSKIYTFKTGKMQQLDYNYYAPTHYFKKKNVLIASFAHGNIYSVYTSDTYYKLEGNKLETILMVEAEAPRGKKKETLYKDAKYNVISKSQFQSKLKKVVGTRKKTKIQINENNVSNRKKYLK